VSYPLEPSRLGMVVDAGALRHLWTSRRPDSWDGPRLPERRETV